MRKVIVMDHPSIVQYIHETCPDFEGAHIVHPSRVTARDVQEADVVGDLSFELAARCARYRAIEFDRAPRPAKPDATIADVRAAGARLEDYTVLRGDAQTLASSLIDSFVMSGLDFFTLRAVFPHLR